MATRKNQKMIWIVLWGLIIVVMYYIIAYVPQQTSFNGHSCEESFGRCSDLPCLSNESKDLLKSDQYATMAKCSAGQNCCVPHEAIQTLLD